MQWNSLKTADELLCWRTKTSLHVSRNPCDRIFCSHSTPFHYVHSVRLLLSFDAWVCVSHSSLLLLLFFLRQHFSALIYVFAFIECHLQNDTETFSMFHSVNVLINIMTHSICMMSQLAHFLCHSLNSLQKQYSRRSPHVTLFSCSFALAPNTDKSSFVCSVGRFNRLIEWTDGRWFMFIISVQKFYLEYLMDGKFDTHARMRHTLNR